MTAAPAYLCYRSIGRRRMARTAHPACGGYCPTIQPGEVYLEVVEFPGGESGYATSAGHPVRMAVCARCACASGNGHLLGDMPLDQLYGQGLA